MGFLIKQHHQDVLIELFCYSLPILLMPNRLVEVEAVYPHSALLAENFRVAQPPAFGKRLFSSNQQIYVTLLGYCFNSVASSKPKLPVYPQHSEKVFHNAGNAL